MTYAEALHQVICDLDHALDNVVGELSPRGFQRLEKVLNDAIEAEREANGEAVRSERGRKDDL